MEPVSTTEEESSTFGVKKIVDCRIDACGVQQYKVVWEETWESAENLSSCQHLIDNFWSFVNIAKRNRQIHEEQRGTNNRQIHDAQQVTNKRVKLEVDPGAEGISMYKLSEDGKEEINKLIHRTQHEGGHVLQSPSNVLESSTGAHHTQQQPCNNSYNNNIHNNIHSNSPAIKMKTEPDCPKKATTPKPTGGNDLSKDNLKYLENFSNPYVKIILVCIKCNEELSMKFQSTWKRHYLTHVDDAEKPFKCQVCGKAFVQPTQLTSHMKRHAKEGKPLPTASLTHTQQHGMTGSLTAQQYQQSPVSFVKPEYHF